MNDKIFVPEKGKFVRLDTRRGHQVLQTYIRQLLDDQNFGKNGYDKIVDPYTKRLVSIYGKIGKKVIKRYTKQLGGGLLSKKYMKISQRPDGQYQIKSLQRYTRLLGKWGYKSWFPITNVKRAGLFVYDVDSGKCWQEFDLKNTIATGRLTPSGNKPIMGSCEEYNFRYNDTVYDIKTFYNKVIATNNPRPDEIPSFLSQKSSSSPSNQPLISQQLSSTHMLSPTPSPVPAPSPAPGPAAPEASPALSAFYNGMVNPPPLGLVNALCIGSLSDTPDTSPEPNIQWLSCGKDLEGFTPYNTFRTYTKSLTIAGKQYQCLKFSPELPYTKKDPDHNIVSIVPGIDPVEECVSPINCGVINGHRQRCDTFIVLNEIMIDSATLPPYINTFLTQYVGIDYNDTKSFLCKSFIVKDLSNLKDLDNIDLNLLPKCMIILKIDWPFLIAWTKWTKLGQFNQLDQDTLKYPSEDKINDFKTKIDATITERKEPQKKNWKTPGFILSKEARESLFKSQKSVYFHFL